MESSTPKFISEHKENKYTPRKTGTVGNKDKEKLHVKNNKKKVEWSLPGKKIGDFFSAEALQCIPCMPNGTKLCMRYHSKFYCFSNCSLKDSHVDLPSTVATKHYE